LPVKRTGAQYTKQCWSDVLRTSAAAIIAAGILAAISGWIADPTRTGALSGWYGILGAIVVIELVWAISYSIWPRKSVLGRDDAGVPAAIAASDG
jgi:rhamnogalacturonyl hydrolase YesR